VEFEPIDLGAVEDPYPLYAAQRTVAPVARSASGYWCITGYDEVEAVLRHPAATTGFLGARFRDVLPEGSAARTEFGRRINLLDPPDHTRVRGLVGRAFTPKRVETVRAWIEGVAARLLDEASAKAAVADGVVDLLPALAHPLPSLVISELLGVPDTDRALLAELTERTAPLLGLTVTSEDMVRGLEASERFAAYVEDLIAVRRYDLGDDLLSALIAAEDDGDRLDHDELLSLVVTLYSAGHRTTRDLFTNGLAALRREPDQLHFVAADPRRATEELVRFGTPTHFVGRIAHSPFDIGGVTIGALEPIIVMLAAANRDPRRFNDPEKIDVRAARDSPALTFALGPHFCLGASLARTEVEVMLTSVLTRWPHLTLADANHGWWNAGPFRGLRSLRVQL
jgi:cytochrome P450